MCSSSCNHSSTHWTEKLAGILFPTLVLTFVTGFIMLLARDRLEIDKTYAWVGTGYLLLLTCTTFVYLFGVWWPHLKKDLKIMKRAVKWLMIDRKVRATTIRLAAIHEELEVLQESYCGPSQENRAQLSREIVNLTEYRDNLQLELGRLMDELKELGAIST